MAKKYLDDAGVLYFWGKLKDYFQVKLVSGTNIKTINNTSVLGSGNISVSVLDFYPVGSYYETSDSLFNPNTSWGGTWVLETEGQVHVSSGANYAVSGAETNTTDGGESTHALTESELPTITGSVQVKAYRTSSGGNKAALVTGSNGAFTTEVSPSTAAGIQVTSASGLGTHFLKMSFGSDGSHNNMQPYIVVNRWHRTA